MLNGLKRKRTPRKNLHEFDDSFVITNPVQQCPLEEEQHPVHLHLQVIKRFEKVRKLMSEETN